MRWFEKPEILSYIIESYAGIEKNKRQFVWETDEGVVIGNSRAFTDHLAERFGLDLKETAWSGLHEALRMLGEIVHGYAPRSMKRGGKFKNQEPEVRILHKKGLT